MSSKTFVIGLDGGATKTDLAIADVNGNVLSVSRGGPSNIVIVGPKGLRKSILEVYKNAMSKIKLNYLRAEILVACLAGVGGPKRKELALRVLLDLNKELKIAKEIILEPDVVAALMSTTLGEEGVVVISGTGSIVFGINRQGVKVRVGGWGYLVNDEGSAYHIGKETIRFALKVKEGRAKNTKLVKEVLRYFKVSDVEEIIDLIVIGRVSVREIASLTPIVVKLAEEGDEVAKEIIMNAINELVDMVVLAVKRLRLKKPKIGVSGSLLLKNAYFYRAFESEIKKRLPNSLIIRPTYPPLIGALVYAYKLLGIPITRELINNLSKGIKCLWV